MNIWIGGEIENDIYDEYRLIRNLVEEKINNLICGLEINDIQKVRILIIIRESNRQFQNVKYKKSRKIFEIEKSIDYLSFKNSINKQKMIVDTITDCINLLPLNARHEILAVLKDNSLQ